MKRVLTFIGGLLAVIFESIFVITVAIGLVVVFFGIFKDDKDINKLTFIMGVIDTLLVIISLIFNSLSLTLINHNPKDFKKKQYIVISAAIINVVIFIVMLFTTSFFKNWLSIFLLIILFVSSALYVIDIFVVRNIKYSDK